MTLSDRTVEDLKRWRVAVIAERDRLTRLIESVDAIIAWEMPTTEVPPQAVPPAVGPPAVEPLVSEPRARKPHDGIGRKLCDLTHTLLVERDQPQHYRDLTRALVESGVEVPGKDAGRNLGAHMSADRRFYPFGAGLWGLREWKDRDWSSGRERPAAD